MLSLVASAVIDLVLFSASFRVLTAADVTTRQVLPAALGTSTASERLLKCFSRAGALIIVDSRIWGAIVVRL